jgi:6-phosphogluconolactonase
MTEKLQLRPLGTPEEIATAAARDFAGLLLRRGDPVETTTGVALSGGRIARPFYDAVVKACGGRDLFGTVHFFWADERCVPATDPENNYRTAREALFAPLAIREENIHRIRGEVEAQYAVPEAEAELCRLMPMSSSGQPILDLVILGMGEDGHVASLFPEEPETMVADPRVFRKVQASKPPPDRITLGYQPLLLAKEVWVLASGQGKADAFRRLKMGDMALPITRVVAGRQSTTMYHDLQEGL